MEKAKKLWNTLKNRYLIAITNTAIMYTRVVAPLLTVLILSVVTSSITYNIGWADKDYCYDQVGDGRNCYETKQKCSIEKKYDDMAESPCYNRDLPDT